MTSSLLPLALGDYSTSWLDLIVRWLHLVVGVTWIGTSIYFVRLDNSFHRPEGADREREDLQGESWALHGGGFYQVRKFTPRPGPLPPHLHIASPWPAYTTWLSGFALLVILYWANADTYLVDPGVADISAGEAVGLSALILVGGLLVYEGLCRFLMGRELLLGAVLLALVAAVAYGAGELFSARAVYILVGSMIGTFMVANVFFVIVPAHHEMREALRRGESPPLAGLARAKQRSVQNTYFTLPLLFFMISNHFPFVYGEAQAWILAAVMTAGGAAIRHFFVLRQQGRTAVAIPVAAAAAAAALVVLLAPAGEDVTAERAGPSPGEASLEPGRRIFGSAGCASCHTLSDAGAEGTTGPNLDESAPSVELVVDRVTNGQGAMPPFAGELTPEQIREVARYVARANAD
jgi:uncharacterized membrane protein